MALDTVMTENTREACASLRLHLPARVSTLSCFVVMAIVTHRVSCRIVNFG